MRNLNGKTGRFQGPRTLLLHSGRFFSRIVLGMFLLPVVLNIAMAQAMETDHRGEVDCDIHHSTCTQALSDIEITLDISPKPVKAMTDLTFKVTLKGKQPLGAPYIDLGMPGMKMGPNRVALRVLEHGVYEGTGIIVRCPSGKRIWKATVTVPGMGSVEFVFDVIY